MKNNELRKEVERTGAEDESRDINRAALLIKDVDMTSTESVELLLIRMVAWVRKSREEAALAVRDAVEDARCWHDEHCDAKNVTPEKEMEVCSCHWSCLCEAAQEATDKYRV